METRLSHCVCEFIALLFKWELRVSAHAPLNNPSVQSCKQPSLNFVATRKEDVEIDGANWKEKKGQWEWDGTRPGNRGEYD